MAKTKDKKSIPVQSEQWPQKHYVLSNDFKMAPNHKRECKELCVTLDHIYFLPRIQYLRASIYY